MSLALLNYDNISQLFIHNQFVYSQRHFYVDISKAEKYRKGMCGLETRNTLTTTLLQNYSRKNQGYYVVRYIILTRYDVGTKCALHELCEFPHLTI